MGLHALGPSGIWWQCTCASCSPTWEQHGILTYSLSASQSERSGIRRHSFSSLQTLPPSLCWLISRLLLEKAGTRLLSLPPRPRVFLRIPHASNYMLLVSHLIDRHWTRVCGFGRWSWPGLKKKWHSLAASSFLLQCVSFCQEAWSSLGDICLGPIVHGDRLLGSRLSRLKALIMRNP